MSKPLIFISHVHEEATLAVAIEEELTEMFLGGIEFFVSSDRQSIRGGDNWLASIKDALNRAAAIIALVSPRSVERAWISFETGAAWLTKRVVPLCHSGIRPSQLPQPLQSLHSLEMHEPADVEELCRIIGQTAGLKTPDADWSRVCGRLSEKARKTPLPALRPYGAVPGWIFPKSEDVGTTLSLAERLDSCSEASFFGIGLNLFWNATYVNAFERRIKTGELRARICMGNFKSPEILRRINEEPEHPIGVPGSEHLARRLSRFERSIDDQSRFELRLFSHYPTYALLIFDQATYVYIYPFRVLGNFSPTFHWSGNDPAAEFFREQFEQMWLSAEPASLVYRDPMAGD